MTADALHPTISALGDRGVLVNFDKKLSDAGNRAAVAFARSLEQSLPAGATEVMPNLVSVLLLYDSRRTSFEQLAGEVRLALSAGLPSEAPPAQHDVDVAFDGDDVEEVAAVLSIAPSDFVAAHNRAPLRVLATGFAPGFVYCGFHGDDLVVPRRTTLRPAVPAGTVLFAAGQTAITSTTVPTGWHVIGHTDFRNFDMRADPPTRLNAGDRIAFRSSP